MGVTIIVALLCGYLTFCLLFYQGQWQLVLHPVHTAATQAPSNLIHFGPDESAIPQRAGVWLPAAPGARYANATILFLPGGDGSLADLAPTLHTLQSLGINVFAFDYRGYGFSAEGRPNQLKMTQDAEAAWQYLTTSRAIPPQQIIPYGTGIGASLAAHLAATHPGIPGIILDCPHTDLLDVALRDPRARLLPVRTLFREHFPLAQPLATLHTPKLLISTTPDLNKAFATASDPKLTVELPTPNQALYTQTLTRFLDQYLSPGSELHPVPSAAPSTKISR
ncbi:MAG TPA: alpha/beta fold hydrolase [Edaphobacter sp.]|nr:alpha/beta fold hydrolase [Edaphobacter sp.]